MKYIVTIVTLLFSISVHASCLLKANPDHPECKLSGFITSEKGLPDNQKVWVCVNYNPVSDETKNIQYHVSGSFSAPSLHSPISKCTMGSRTVRANASPIIYDTCGDFRIYTTVATKAESEPREGHVVDLIVETTELRPLQQFYGQGKSVCEIAFIETQILEISKDTPKVGWDCR
jgi:hypothetical protein